MPTTPVMIPQGRVGGNAACLPSRILSEREAAVGGGWWVVVMERVLELVVEDGDGDGGNASPVQVRTWFKPEVRSSQQPDLDLPKQVWSIISWPWTRNSGPVRVRTSDCAVQDWTVDSLAQTGQSLYLYYLVDLYIWSYSVRTNKLV